MRKLIAMVVSLAAVGAHAADVTWTGADATDPTDWFAPDNWSGAAVPAAGDSVTIGSGASVVLSNSTPALASVSVAGTMTFTNWTTCLSATTVTIPSGGTLTCAGPFTDTEMSNRVWIACTDLTVASGGRIDVTDRGYDHSYGSGTDVLGNGPGAGYKRSTTYRPATHGGWGSAENHFNYAKASVVYDSASEPVSPGSGGYGNTSTAGGAVRIDATGTVSLSGDILADAADVGDTSTQYRTPGSGGSILIFCNRFVGAESVRLSANGGGFLRVVYPKDEARFPGAGGRIAIHYSSEAQQLGDTDGVFFSAASGWDKGRTGAGNDRYPSMPYLNINAQSSQNGTLWFTDNKIFGENSAFLGTHFAGRLSNNESVMIDGDLVVTNRLGFANDGVSLSVAGNLTVRGKFGCLAFGVVETTSTYARKTACGARPVSLTVGGNFTMEGGARADIHAGATNGTDKAGAVVVVGGEFSVGAGSTLYLYSHPVNGGAPLIEASSFTLAETGVISADTFGFESAANRTTDGLGPGGGTGVKKSPYASTAGSYGGLGGGAAEGKMYGSDIYPDMPGSAGATGYTMPTAGTLTAAGGGVVHVKVTGAIVVNGSISANGALTGGVADDTGRTFGGGSGGAILLEGKTFSGGAAAVLSADGGSSTATYARGGGGGRISVIVGDKYSPDIPSSRLSILESMPDSFLGTATVAGGTVGSADTGIAGADGTIRFVTVNSRSGLAIFVR